MKIEIRFTRVDNKSWLLANLYVLTSINKRLNKNNVIIIYNEEEDLSVSQKKYSTLRFLMARCTDK